MPDFTQITYSVTDRVATLTLSRPEKLNAFTVTMMREIVAAFDLADADDDVRAVIVTGAGRAFCAGADLSSGEKTFDHGPDEGRVLREIVYRVAAIPELARAAVDVTHPRTVEVHAFQAAVNFDFVLGFVHGEFP